MFRGFFTDSVTSVLLKHAEAAAAESLDPVPMAGFTEAAIYGFVAAAVAPTATVLTLQVQYGTDTPIDLSIEHFKVCDDVTASALYVDTPANSDGTVDLPATASTLSGFVVEVPPNILPSAKATQLNPPKLIVKTTAGANQDLTITTLLYGGVHKGQYVDPLA